MAGQTISKFRLLLNGVGSAAIALSCLPLGMLALLQWTAGNAPDASSVASESARVVQGILTMAGILGLVALVSLARTVRAWRRLKQEEARARSH